jgi:hypothetical protein
MTDQIQAYKVKQPAFRSFLLGSPKRWADRKLPGVFGVFVPVFDVVCILDRIFDHASISSLAS